MRILGGILLAVGILIAGASGLCSLLLLIQEIGNANAELAESLWIIALVGGIPFCIGGAMAFGGWRLFKRSAA